MRSLWIASALTQAATLAMRIVVAYRLLELGYGATTIALVAAGFSAIPGAFAIPLGRWADRSGAKSKGILGAAVLTVSGLGLLEIQSVVVTGVLVVVYGLGHLLCIVSQQSLVAELVPEARLGVGFARYNLFTSIGQVAGPLLVTGVESSWLEALGLVGFDGRPVIVTALGIASVVASALIPTPDPRRQGTEAAPRPAGVREHLRRRGMLAILATCFSSVVATEVLLVFLPVWGEERGVPKNVVGVLLAVRAGATIVGQGFVGRLLDRWPKAGIVRAALFMSGVSLAVLPWCSALGAVVPVVFIGLAFGVTQPVTLAWVVGITDPESRGAVLGVRMTVQRTAQVGVPLASSLVAAATGIGAVFWPTALLLWGTTLLPLKE